MYGNPNWQAAAARYEDFWNHRLKGRPILSVTCPEPNPPADAPQFSGFCSLEEQWLNPATVYQAHVADMARQRVYAEGYFRKFINLGPGFMAAMVGGSYKLAPDTVWFDNGPVVEDYGRDLDKVQLDWDCEASRILLKMTRYFAERSNGRYITSVSDLGGNLDIAASLRGNTQLLLDIYDDPEGILALTEKIDSIWQIVYTRLMEIISSSQDGADSWMGVWCSGTTYPLQCDFCAMLSPSQFDRFVLPSLQRQCEFLEHPSYHLDGPDCICHLPSLLSLEKLDAIQWVPGAGAAPYDAPCWKPVFRQIQDAGKNVIILGASVSEAENLMRMYDPSRLYISLWCNSAEEAESLLEMAEKLA